MVHFLVQQSACDSVKFSLSAKHLEKSARHLCETELSKTPYFRKEFDGHIPTRFKNQTKMWNRDLLQTNACYRAVTAGV